jgi:hypothetical protein
MSAFFLKLSKLLKGSMMTRNTSLLLVISIFIVSTLSCTPTPEPCSLTANIPVTAYRLPDITSDIFGVMPQGDTFEILARTADGWLGFDPGVAQAGNRGLARHRWVLVNLTLSPSCLDTVDLVTLADIEEDLSTSNP